MTEQYGLVWEAGGLDLRPEWTVEPEGSALDAIVRGEFELTASDRCDIKFYAQGGFNKLYSVETDSGKWLLRVALPVDPQRKTASEVATIKFVRETTTIPVPGIRAFDSSADNDLRFEWILMDFIEAKQLRSIWREWDVDDHPNKSDWVRQIVYYQAQLFQVRFDQIGNIYDTSNDCKEERPVLGPMVQMWYFWGDRGVRNDISKGPFKNSHEWFTSRLNLLLSEQQETAKDSENERIIERAEDTIDTAEQLVSILPKIFPPDEAEAAVIHHDDLSLPNILVDAVSEISAIVDWECVSTYPLWRACQVPRFLEGPSRTDKPNRDDYAPYDPQKGDGTDDPRFEALDNHGVTGLFWDDMLEYDREQLRKVFLEEMRKLSPEWIQIYERSQVKRDFETALERTARSWRLGQIDRWIEAYENGAPIDLITGMPISVPEVSLG